MYMRRREIEDKMKYLVRPMFGKTGNRTRILLKRRREENTARQRYIAIEQWRYSQKRRRGRRKGPFEKERHC